MYLHRHMSGAYSLVPCTYTYICLMYIAWCHVLTQTYVWCISLGAMYLRIHMSGTYRLVPCTYTLIVAEEAQFDVQVRNVDARAPGRHLMLELKTRIA